MPYESSSVQLASRETEILSLIRKSHWWHRACHCLDSHHSNTSGVMLADHLNAVTANIERIFRNRTNPFLAQLFALLEDLNMDKEQVREELRIVSLLHDIGKLEEDKSQMVPHPLCGYPTTKRHAIVSVTAALDILDNCHLLSEVEKATIYSVIEEHDVSYGLFREFKAVGSIPPHARWKKLNEKIHDDEGVGLMYLLLFKLADTHGHGNIEDVTWFYQNVKTKYFAPLGLELPIPTESDIR